MIHLLKQGLHPSSLTSAVSALNHMAQVMGNDCGHHLHSWPLTWQEDPIGRTLPPEFPRHLFKLPQHLSVQKGRRVRPHHRLLLWLGSPWRIQNSWGSFWISSQISGSRLSECTFGDRHRKTVPNVQSAITLHSLCLSYQRGRQWKLLMAGQTTFPVPKYKLYPYTCYSLLKGVILIQPILAYLTPVK